MDHGSVRPIQYATNNCVLIGGEAYTGCGLHPGLNELYSGYLDEVRIWNVALNAQDILNFYNCELSGTEPGLVAYYNFNQGVANGSNSSITTLTDLAFGTGGPTMEP